MTDDCWARLRRLREIRDFREASIETLLVDCVLSSCFEEVETVLAMLKSEAQQTVDEKFRAIAERLH
jgi:hypothetical protein